MGFRDLVHREFSVWGDFREAIRRDSEFDPLATRDRVIWRGQRDSAWTLSSAWERYVRAQIRRDTPRADYADIIRGYQEVEQARFRERFRDHLAGLPGMPSLEQLHPPEKVWAIGRHHGLTTPLLDWSEKPYLALFFAISDLVTSKVVQGELQKEIEIEDQDEVALYRLNVTPEMRRGASPFDDLTIVWERYDSVGRLLAQRGLFTWLRSTTLLDLESYLGSLAELEHLGRYVLKGKAIVEAVADLDAHGIDWRLVYPDVHGAALSTNALLHDVY